MDPIKVIAIGNSVGIILSKELSTKLRVGKGDMIYATETPNGIELRAYNESFANQMDMAEKVMHKYRDVLKKLAE